MFKNLFVVKLILVTVLPCLGMNNESELSDKDKIEQLFSTKHKITQDNFNKAMKMIATRPAGSYLAEKLSNKLIKFVEQELSVNEWTEEVIKAYEEFIKDISTSSLIVIKIITMAHPLEEILFAAIWAMPSE